MADKNTGRSASPSHRTGRSNASRGASSDNTADSASVRKSSSAAAAGRSSSSHGVNSSGEGQTHKNRTSSSSGKRAVSRAKQARRRRRRRIRRLVCLILIIVLLIGGYCYNRFRAYDSYKVTASLSITNGSEFIDIEEFGNGYVKITESGITYFNKKGTIWAQTYSMTQPVYDICKGYIAVADIKQSEIYIFDSDGLVNTFSSANSIIDIEVSKAGVVAVATDDDEANYIEVYDRTGSAIVTARSVFESSGYLTDITLSTDGTKLAAAFINVDLLDIVSRVVFYDFSQDDDEADVIVGGFNQYTDTILTNVEFLSGSRVVAVGDNAFTVYDFSGTPEIIYEDLEYDNTIRSVFFSEKYFGFIIDDSTGAYNYIYQIYDRSGEIRAQAGFDFSYTDVRFYAKSVMLTSANACHIYTFNGLERFSCAFEENIITMCPVGYASLIWAASDETYFIRMK